MKNKISVILPTYNEKDNIVQLIDELSNHLSRKEFEIIVVDDNSPDGTSLVVDDKKKNNKNVKLLCRTNKRGLTSALNDGIAIADGKIIVWMDCDFQMPPSIVPELVEKIGDGYDVAVGSRYVKGGKDLRYNQTIDHKLITIVHTYLSLAICRLTTYIFSSKQTDWTSGFIAIKSDIFDRIDLFGDYGEYFMYLIHHLENSGYKITEIPYILGTRLAGESKTSYGYLNMISKGIKYIWAIFRLKLLDILYYSIYKKKTRYYDYSQFND
jgi:dolichol-phosphate mannosyltransferase